MTDKNSQSQENPENNPETEQNSDKKYSMFDTPEYRSKVESKLQPFDLKELLSNGVLTQTVPITEDLNITFTTIEHGIQYIFDRILAKRAEFDENLDRVSLHLQLAAHIKAINNQPLSSALLEYTGDNDEEYLEYLETKLQTLKTYNSHFVTLLLTHYFWFQERVADFFRNKFTEELENF